MKKLLLSFAAALMGMSAFAGNYEMVTSVDGITTTDTYVLTYMANDQVVAMMGDFESSNKYLSPITEGFEFSAPVLTTTTAAPVEFKFVAGTKADNYAICNVKTGKYLIMTEQKNVRLAWNDAVEDKCNVAVSFDDSGVLQILFTNYTGNNKMRYNKDTNPGRFTNYSGVQPCTLFKVQDAAETRQPAGLGFSESKVTLTFGDEFVAPTFTKATTAAVTFTSDNEEVATVNATTGEVEILAVGSARITASAEANDEYLAGTASYLIVVTKPVVTKTVTLATEISNGQFAIVTPKGVAKNYTGSNSSYGYLYLEAVEIANNTFECNEDYLITFTRTDNGYTMVDNRGIFLGMDASHFGAINFYDAADAEGSNCYWNVEFTGTDAKVSNAGRTDGFLSYKEYNGDWEIVTTDGADKPLVQLYKVDDGESGIDAVVVDENAPVEYYNLQGIRVANPDNGIYIRRQGNKVTKVLVK